MKCLVLFIALAVTSSSLSAGSWFSFSKPDVVVVDELGRPVKDAEVEPVSLSINYSELKTNKKGEVSISWKVQPVEWISVSKKDYEATGHIQYRGEKRPVKVVLKKVIK